MLTEKLTDTYYLGSTLLKLLTILLSKNIYFIKINTQIRTQANTQNYCPTQTVSACFQMCHNTAHQRTLRLP